jgi:hypothetical protein
VAGASLGEGAAWAGGFVTRSSAMSHGELLQRIARTLKQDVGPAIEAEYPKTQAFMAAVVLEKLGRQPAATTTRCTQCALWPSG